MVSSLKPQLVAFLLAMALVPLMLWLSENSAQQLMHSRDWVEHTYQVLSRLEQMRNQVEVMESARRGYVITREERYLHVHHAARVQIRSDMALIKRLTRDNPIQQEKLLNVEAAVEGLEIASQETLGQTGETVLSAAMEQAKFSIDQFRTLAEEMRAEENRLLTLRTSASASRLHDLKLLMMGMSLAFLGLLLFTFYSLYLEIRHRKKVEEGLLELKWVNELTVTNLSLLGEMTSLLQACGNTEESLAIIQQFAPRLLNVDTGVLYLFRESRNQVEAALNWGRPASSEPIFEPDDCWALRRGEVHILDEAHHMPCKHVEARKNLSTFCVPIVAQGNVQGILYLENQQAGINDGERSMATTLANQIALALASIKLRDTLRNLSVRDPLTGLFNRRYMEESLQREVATAQRKNRSLGVTLFDLDHFKTFNDTFGHDAGDHLLREVGRLLLNSSRAGDIVCRFGGEEFVLIYQEANFETVFERVDQLRQAIHGMQVQHFGRSLGQISASFGIAMFPDHGDTGELLLRHADKALYRAKAAGRNCIES